MKDFMTLKEVKAYFDNEQKALQYLEMTRWNGSPTCPHCGELKVYRFTDGKRFKCSSCREQFTAKIGTIFEDSKVPLHKWYIAIYHIIDQNKEISSHKLAKYISVTQKTAWHMLHKIRFGLGIEANRGQH